MDTRTQIFVVSANRNKEIEGKIMIESWLKSVLLKNTTQAKNVTQVAFFTVKGTVQRKLRGVEYYINKKVYFSHWTADILFLNLKGTGSLNRKKHVSAA